MALKWTDVHELAMELLEVHPEVNPMAIRFTDLRQWVMALENFDDDPSHCGEKVLEAIQMAWMDEKD